VIAINYIIKSRAHKYIAAVKEEWLYPEDRLAFRRWDEIGRSHLLMPDPRSMSFSSEIIVGYKDKTSDAFDEYGRKPWHSDYNDKTLHDYEWNSFHAFKGEFARQFGPKRRGISFDFGHKVIEDSPDYHAYHLRLESECKAKIFRSNCRRKKKK